MRRALLIISALILYGCLYPFRFHPLPPGGWDLFWHWPVPVDQFVLRDGVLNVILYMPFGALAFLTVWNMRRSWLRLLLPPALALLLSTSIEFLQLMDYTRMSSVFDVVCNVAGATIGTLLAYAYRHPLLRITRRTPAPAPRAPMMLLILWLGYQLFPLFPSIGFYWLRRKTGEFAHAHFSPAELALACIEWLVLASILKKLLPDATARRCLALFLLLLPARFALLGRNLTPSELAGALLGCAIWWLWINRSPRADLILAFLMVATVVHLELSPYRFSTVPQRFSWIPLAGFIETGPDYGAVVFLRKCFWYGAAIWTGREITTGYLKPALTISLLLGALEWLQRYLPGRTPELTDPLLALLLALFLHLAEQCSPAGKVTQVKHSADADLV